MSSLFPKLYHPGQMEPIVEIGQNVLLQKPTGYDLYQVIFQEPLPESAPLTVNLATSGIAAGATTGATPVALNNQEYMNYGELGQFRFHVLDPVSVALQQGQGQARNTTQLAQGLFTMRSRFTDPTDSWSEHYVYQQNPAYMVATNYNAVTLVVARVAIWGFRHVLRGLLPNTSVGRGVDQQALAHFVNLQAALESGLKFTVVPVNGWGQ